MDASAQVSATATLQGTVVDKSGAVITGAAVKITAKATGAVRTDTSNNSGTYQFNLLPVGIYEVRITVPGFATRVFENVELAVSRTTTIDAQMSPSQQAETITVEASGAASVDLQKTDVSRPITPAEVQDLPLNGRDFVNLAILAPGARPVNSYDPTKNRIGVFATNGSSGRNVNVTVNGVDNKDGTVGGPVMQLPLESILEFNISTQRFSAVNGRSEGAAVNVITKSGGNVFHGSLFFQDRDQVLNALNYFEQTAHGGSGTKAPFSRQQFGGSVGGPIKKDKTFIFFALERSREQTSINVNSNAYQQALAAKALGLDVTPIQTIATPYFDWRYNGRVDHKIDDRNSLNFSYSNQNNIGNNDQSQSYSDGTQANFTTNQVIISNLSLNSVLSPSVVNSATVGFQYWHNVISANPLVTNLTFGQGTTPDLSTGTSTAVPQESYQRKWQFKDDIAFNKGKHAFKTGFDYLWEPQLGGILGSPGSPPTIAFFLDPTQVLNNPAYPLGFSTPGMVSSITQNNAGNPYFNEHGKMFGLYFQDDWKATKRLTLNLGIRWDKDFGLFGADQQKTAQAYLELKAIGSPYASSLPHDDSKDFSPRFGLAYDVTGTGKHVIRAGYGLYYGQAFINIPLFMETQTGNSIFAANAYSNNVVPGTTSGTSDTLPSGILLQNFRYKIDSLPPRQPGAPLLSAGATGQIMDPAYQSPYSEQFNAGYAWQITSGSVIEVEYVHSLGIHESKRIVINPKVNGVRSTDALFAAAGLPVLGQIRDSIANGRSRYDGMNLSYRKRLSNRFTVNANYVLSRGLAYNGQAAAFGNAPTNELVWFLPSDLGPTPADERHRITVSGLVILPGKITIAPIMQWATGRPYDAQEGISDVYGWGGGQSNTHVIVLNSDPTNLFATKAYTATQLQQCLTAATCHQVGYDYLRGEDFFQLDLRVSRAFKFKERMNMEFFFQAFDLTNRANFGASYGTSMRSSNFQQPTGFITPGGVIVPKSFAGEFGARFSF